MESKTYTEEVKRINEWLAGKLANTLSSMTFFYICLLLDAVELPPVIGAHSIIVWCTYISQTVIQLIALPILGAQQKMTHKHHEKHHADIALLHKKIDKILKK